MVKTEVLEALNSGLCVLVYEKLDGEIRAAIGTQKLDLIPVEHRPKGTGKPNANDKQLKLEFASKENLIHYYDTNSKGYRCFWLDNLKSLSLV